MALTVRDIVTDALGELGVVAAGNVPDDGMMTHALRRLNDYLGLLAVKPATILKETRTEWTITAGTQDYSVGTGATVNVGRPALNAVQAIAFLNTLDSPNIEFNRAAPLTEDEWEREPVKALSSTYPSRARYNPTFPNGTITIWPNPTTTTLKGVLYALEAVVEFASINDSISTIPGALRQTLVKNLALQLAPAYKIIPVPQELKDQAREALADWKASNFRPKDMPYPRESLISENAQGRYDIVTDRYRP